VAPDAPERYTVQKGDTLWDISAKFLTDPWYWPEIWHINPQVANPHLIYPGDVLALTWVEGQPRVVLESGGPIRLSPQVREHPLSEAIYAIPYDRIKAFVSRPDVLAAEQVEAAPYVVRGRDQQLISAEGEKIYVRRFDAAANAGRYDIYHVGDELKDPDDGDVLGYQGLYAGLADFRQAGDPATLMLVESARETTEGDILLPDTVELKPDFIPHAPAKKIDGTIIAVTSDQQRTVTGEFDVVIINRGTRDGLEPGHVLAIWETGEEVIDKSAQAVSRKARLPDERIALCMLFKTYERLSYGLILESSREVRPGEAVRTP
ncbi:MAG: LysM peptidoglycan-binding domain-containing protein, partial [Steroidobacteraceae bacterium]